MWKQFNKLGQIGLVAKAGIGFSCVNFYGVGRTAVRANSVQTLKRSISHGINYILCLCVVYLS